MHPVAVGVRDLILDGSVLNLQMHESIGHALNSTRAGMEANFSGVSWATPDKSASCATAATYSTSTPTTRWPLGMATVGYDDEAVNRRACR